MLVRLETSPEDIEGMNVATGILTCRGGLTSHAAVVARGMGKSCVCGFEDMVVDSNNKILKIKEYTIKEGDWMSINGSTGEVYLGKV